MALLYNKAYNAITRIGTKFKSEKSVTTRVKKTHGKNTKKSYLEFSGLI